MNLEQLNISQLQELIRCIKTKADESKIEISKGIDEFPIEMVDIISEFYPMSEILYNNGIAYYYGEGVEEDKKEAVKLWRKAADRGHPGAMLRLGDFYSDRYKNSSYSGYNEAVEWYRKAAEGGNVDAMFELGNAYHYFSGIEIGIGIREGYGLELGWEGVERDEKEAVKWWRKAAERGHAAAMNNLGYAYDHGRGIEQDEKEAVKWYRKAAERGDTEAMFNLGHCYQSGYGVEQDYKEAIKWYRKAADKGNAKAMRALENASEDFVWYEG